MKTDKDTSKPIITFANFIKFSLLLLLFQAIAIVLNLYHVFPLLSIEVPEKIDYNREIFGINLEELMIFLNNPVLIIVSVLIWFIFIFLIFQLWLSDLERKNPIYKIPVFIGLCITTIFYLILTIRVSNFIV